MSDKPPLKVRLSRVGPAAFEATGETSGATLTLDGTPEIGGEGRGMRPMELLLSALAGCAAMDVVHILTRQKEPLEDLTIDVAGHRVDATPAPFERVHLRFVASGAVAPNKLERAVRLSVEKYCSVRLSLGETVEVTHEWSLAGADEAE